MATKKEIIAKAAADLGYDGDAPKTTMQAVNALVEAMGGEAVSGTQADAFKALAGTIVSESEDAGETDQVPK